MRLPITPLRHLAYNNTRTIYELAIGPKSRIVADRQSGKARRTSCLALLRVIASLLGLTVQPIVSLLQMAENLLNLWQGRNPGTTSGTNAREATDGRDDRTSTVRVADCRIITGER
jgi:hypothetical protein